MNGMKEIPTALFHRQYLNYQGGHGKVWDYFNHVERSMLYQPSIYFTEDSVLGGSNPWANKNCIIAKKWEPAEAGLLFLAGNDWQAVPEDLPRNIPCINLIQGIRHADKSLPLYSFLSRRAYRICVSHEVADAILSTGKVNGPVSVIPNGVSLDELSASSSSPVRHGCRPVAEKLQKNRITDRLRTALGCLFERLLQRPQTGASVGKKIFIAAMKDAAMGKHLSHQLQNRGYPTDLLTHQIDRSEFLSRLRDAWLAVLLPFPEEGFFLPGLEAMALGTPVIMPDCLGNREYAINGENCFLVEREKILEVIGQLTPIVLDNFQIQGIKTASTFTLENEYQHFIEILQNINSLLA